MFSQFKVKVIQLNLLMFCCPAWPERMWGGEASRLPWLWCEELRRWGLLLVTSCSGQQRRLTDWLTVTPLCSTPLHPPQSSAAPQGQWECHQEQPEREEPHTFPSLSLSPLVLMLAVHQTGGDIFSVWEGLDWCSWSPSYTPSDHLIDQSGQQSVRGLAWPPARPSALQDLPPPRQPPRWETGLGGRTIRTSPSSTTGSVATIKTAATVSFPCQLVSGSSRSE